MSNDASPKLVRELSLLDATMIVVGSMIGSGVFIVSAESSRLVGLPGGLLAGWGLAGGPGITGARATRRLRALLRGTGCDVAAGRRTVRVSPRSVWTFDRISFWLGSVSDHS